MSQLIHGEGQSHSIAAPRFSAEQASNDARTPGVLQTIGRKPGVARAYRAAACPVLVVISGHIRPALRQFKPLRNTTDVISVIDTFRPRLQSAPHKGGSAHGTFPRLRQPFLPFRPRLAGSSKATPPGRTFVSAMPGMRFAVVCHVPILCCTLERDVARPPRALRALPSSVSRARCRVV
jgi:hypothetical protein